MDEMKPIVRKRVDVVTIKMVKESSVLYSGRKITSAAEATSLLRVFVGDIDREQFVALYLNTRKEPNAIHTVSIGTLNGSLVHPREVFKAAILSNASCIIIAHNHPSGGVSPSDEDKALTKRLVEAGKIFGLEIIDHIILGDGDQYFSIKEQGMI